MGDYWAHWLEMGTRMKHPPRVYRVNWFRRDEQDRFLWPGFGENLRVLMWILERCAGRGKATSTPLGNVPTPDALDRDGLDISDATLAKLLTIDDHDWSDAVIDQRKYLESLGARVPEGIWQEHRALAARLGSG
jgi:phosphoenolpyruvate carboxykinase (GTP)